MACLAVAEVSGGAAGRQASAAARSGTRRQPGRMADLRGGEGDDDRGGGHWLQVALWSRFATLPGALRSDRRPAAQSGSPIRWRRRRASLRPDPLAPPIGQAVFGVARPPTTAPWETGRWPPANGSDGRTPLSPPPGEMCARRPALLVPANSRHQPRDSETSACRRSRPKPSPYVLDIARELEDARARGHRRRLRRRPRNRIQHAGSSVDVPTRRGHSRVSRKWFGLLAP